MLALGVTIVIVAQSQLGLRAVSLPTPHGNFVASTVQAGDDTPFKPSDGIDHPRCIQYIR